MKTAKTIEEQITLLRSRGVVIDDEDKAKEVLLDIGYYRLGFYLFPFEKTYPSKRDRTHEVVDGTNLATAVALYYFDFDMRNILLRYISRIEVAFRTYITYYISNKYKDLPTWFVSPKIVKNDYIKSFDTIVYTEDFKKNATIHRHHKKYINDKYAPAWKTIELMSFGAVICLYKNLKNTDDKLMICRCFGMDKIDDFINYIDTVRLLRNKCAHCYAIFDLNLPVGIRGGYFQIPRTKSTSISTAINVVLFLLRSISKNRSKDMQDDIKEAIEAAKIKRVDLQGIVDNVENFCAFSSK